jgi:hypothetical protein
MEMFGDKFLKTVKTLLNDGFKNCRGVWRPVSKNYEPFSKNCEPVYKNWLTSM